MQEKLEKLDDKPPLELEQQQNKEETKQENIPESKNPWRKIVENAFSKPYDCSTLIKHKPLDALDKKPIIFNLDLKADIERFI